MSKLQINTMEQRKDGLWYPTYEYTDENNVTKTETAQTGWSFYPFPPRHHAPTVIRLVPWTLAAYVLFVALAIFWNWHMLGVALIMLAGYLLLMSYGMHEDTRSMRRVRKRVKPVICTHIGDREVCVAPPDGGPEYTKLYPVLQYEWNGKKYYRMGWTTQLNEENMKLYVDEQSQWVFSEAEYLEQVNPTTQILCAAIAFATTAVGLAIFLTLWV